MPGVRDCLAYALGHLQVPFGSTSGHHPVGRSLTLKSHLLRLYLPGKVNPFVQPMVYIAELRYDLPLFFPTLAYL